MKLVFAYSQGKIQEDSRFFLVPRTLVLDGIEMECTLPTQVALMCDYSRTVGIYELAFPFREEEQVRIAREVVRSYTSQGFNCKTSFPLYKHK